MRPLLSDGFGRAGWIATVRSDRHEFLAAKQVQRGMEFRIVWHYGSRADALALQLPLLFGRVVEMRRASGVGGPQRAVPPHRDIGRRAECKLGRNCTELRRVLTRPEPMARRAHSWTVGRCL